MKTIGDSLPRRFKAKASGAITAGKPLIVEADGDVAQISATAVSVSEAIGTSVVYNSGNTTYNQLAYDSSAGKIVIAYRDSGNSDRGTAIVGTVSGTSISFGSEVVFETGATQYIGIAYDSNAQKIVIAYEDDDNSDYGTAVVGTVSGTSISFGTPVVFASATTSYVNAVYDENAQKVVMFYRDQGNSNYGTAIVGTVSGTSISFGSEVVFEAAATQFISSAYDSSAQKVIVSYEDEGNGDYGTAIVGTVSGTSISFGTAAVFESASMRETSTTYDANANRVVVAYCDSANSSYGTAAVGTVSGTSISFGTPVVFESANSSEMRVVYHVAAKKPVISYRDSGNSGYITAIVGTVSGTSISFNTPSVLKSVGSSSVGSVYDASADNVVVAFYDESGGDGTAVVYQAAYTGTNLTAENYIGIAEYAAADTETATVLIKGGVITGSTLVPLGFTFGSETVFEQATLFYGGSTYDSTNNRVVRTYRDNGNSGYGTVVVGSVSGTTITWGTPVVFASAATQQNDVAFDSGNGKVVICFEDGANSSYGTAIVGTVSGTSISFGSETVFESAEVRVPVIVYDANAGKVVIAYNDDGNSNYGTAIVGTVSGTSISFGTAVVFESANTSQFGMAYDANAQKIALGYQDGSTGKARVGTVSGTSISFGSSTTFLSSTASDINPVYDPDTQKVVFAYRDEGDSNKGKARVGTISGTSISFGTEVTFADHTAYMFENNCAVYSTADDKVIIGYEDGDATILKTVIGTISGTDISFTSPQNVAGDTAHQSVVYDSNANSVVYMYRDTDNDNYGTGIAGQLSQDLTPGQTYFVQTDGTLGLTAGNPSVTAGTAVASNKLIVKG
jgi:hypothetical protein